MVKFSYCSPYQDPPKTEFKIAESMLSQKQGPQESNSDFRLITKRQKQAFANENITEMCGEPTAGEYRIQTLAEPVFMQGESGLSKSRLWRAEPRSCHPLENHRAGERSTKCIERTCSREDLMA